MTATESIDFRQAPAELDQQLDDLILPEWWDGTPAIPTDRYEVDAGGQADLDPAGDLAAEMQRVYDEVGLVHVRNTGLTELADMRTLAQHCLPGEMKYEGGSNPRGALEANVFEVGVYNHWQLSMDTDDSTEAEAYARERGLFTEWGPDRLLKTRYYCEAFEYDPVTDRNLFYCSIADHGMWFDGWPLVMHLPHNDRPLHMTFGDDSEFSRDELQQMVSQYDRFGIKVDWRVGEIAVFDNFRFAHGRPGIELTDGEERQLGVILGPKYDRVGTYRDKW